MCLQRDLSHLRNHPAYREAIRAHRQVFMGQHVFQLHSIDRRKYPFQEGFGDLEADEQRGGSLRANSELFLASKLL